MKTRALIRSFLSLLLFVSAIPLRAATITWTNTSGGNWNVSQNWSPNAVPGSVDTALINTPGTYTVNVNVAADVFSLTVGGAAGVQTLQVTNNTLTATNAAINGTLTATSATLNGAFSVNTGGVLNDSGGTLGATGSLTVQGNGVLNVAPSTFTLLGPLTNAGTVNLTNATLYIYNNNNPASYLGGVVNQGVINFYGASGDAIISYGFGDEYVYNSGTINEELGAGNSSVNAYFGVLQGTYNAAAGTTVQFSSGVAAFPLAVGTPPVLNGPGQYQFTSGYLLLNAVAIPNLLLKGGTLELGPAFEGGAITNLTLDGITLGAGAYQINGTLIATNGSTLNGAITVNSGGVLDEYAGTLAVTGSLTVQSNGVLNVAASTFTLLGPLTNAGTVNLTNATLYIYNNNNPASYLGGVVNQGVIDFYGASGDAIISYGFGDEYVYNSGTINEELGAGNSSVNAYFGVLQGTYNAAAGTTVQFSSGVAAFPLAVGTPPVLNGPGQYQFTSGYLLLNAVAIPNLLLKGGTLELGPAFEGGAITNLTLDGITLGAGAYQINGTLIATNGSTLNGAITVNSGGVLDEYAGTLAVTGSLTVQSNGVLNVAASTFTLLGPLTNAGTVNLTNATLYIYNNNNPASYLGGVVNQGVIDFYGASGDAIISYGFGDEYVYNSGTINEELGAGNSSVNAYFGVLQGTYNAAAGTTVQFSSGVAAFPLAVGTPPVLNGPGQYQFTSGYLLLNAVAIPNLLLKGGTLELGPAFEGGAITNLTLDGITLGAGAYQINGTLIATNGSTLNGAITVNSGGVLDEYAGTLAVTGSLTVQSNGVLNVAASTFTLLGPLTNAGTVNLTNATLYIYNNNNPASYLGGVVNQGVIDFYGASGDAIISYGFGDEYVYNSGTINEELGAGNSSVNAYFGVLQGTYNAAAGTTVQFSSGAAAFPLAVGTPPVLNGPGQYQFTSGYLLLNAVAIPNLLLKGGTLELGPAFEQGGAITNLTLDGITLAGNCKVNGTLVASNSVFIGAITVNSGGVLDEYAGTLAVTGSLTVQSNGVLNMAPSTFTLLGPLTNAGTLNLTNAILYIYDNNNPASYLGGVVNQGVIDFYGASGDAIISYGFGDEYVYNSGTINEELGAGNSSVNAYFGVLQGTYNAVAGTIVQFYGGGATNQLAVGTPPVLNGPGQYVFISGYLLLNAVAIPNLLLKGGTLELGLAFEQGGAITNLTLDGITLGAAAYQVNGTLIASNSILNGAITVNSGGVLDEYAGTVGAIGSLTVQGGGVLNVAASTVFYLFGPLTNAGIVNLTNATLDIYNNNTATYVGGIVNQIQGVINFYGVSGDQISAYPFGYEYMVNAGTVSQRPGTGNSSITPTLFTDSGTLDSEEGTLTIQSGISLQASSVLSFGLNSLTDYGKITLVSNVVVNGALDAHFNNGFVPAPNSSFTVLTYPSFSGQFASVNLPASAVWQRIFGNTALTLVTRPPFTLTLVGTTNLVFKEFGTPATQSVLITSTNLAQPLSQWTPVVTNTFDITGVSGYTNYVNLTILQQYFALKFP